MATRTATTRSKTPARKGRAPATKRRTAVRRRNPGFKLGGISVATVAIETALASGGGFVSGYFTDLVDEQILDRLDVSGPLRGAGKALAAFGTVWAGHYLTKKYGKKMTIDIMPFVYGMTGPLGHEAYSDVMGIGDADIEEPLDGFYPGGPPLLDAEMQGMGAGYLEGGQHMQGQHMQGSFDIDPMQGLFLTDDQLGVPGSGMAGI
ncbi:hypothetical protein K0U83_00150 [bacterium]|nr:hypothetical protein [bacterium]